MVYLHDIKHEKYPSVAGARSALSAFLPEREGVSFGKNAIVSRTLKGIFRARPSLPKHTMVYDTNIILKYMAWLAPNDMLLLQELTKKLVTLLCILSGQRAQSIANLNLGFMHHTSDMYTFYIPEILKTTTPTFHQTPLEFDAFEEDKRLCAVDCLDEYIERTKLIGDNLNDKPK